MSSNGSKTSILSWFLQAFKPETQAVRYESQWQEMRVPIRMTCCDWEVNCCKARALKGGFRNPTLNARKSGTPSSLPSRRVRTVAEALAISATEPSGSGYRELLDDT